eukprot:1380589-Amphidinium_carterae.1
MTLAIEREKEARTRPNRASTPYTTTTPTWTSSRASRTRIPQEQLGQVPSNYLVNSTLRVTPILDPSGGHLIAPSPSTACTRPAQAVGATTS